MARQEANKVFALTSLLYGANAAYIEDLYAQYKENPNSVEAEWQDFFASFQDTKEDVLKEARGAPWKRKDWPIAASGDLVNAFDGDWAPIEKELGDKLKKKAEAKGAPATEAEVHQATRDSVRALMMIRAYRMRGHLHANLDPLGLAALKDHEELHPASYGFTEADWDRKIFIDHVLGLEYATIREMLDILKRTYCSTLGVEFMHISDPAAKSWLQERIEGPDKQVAFTKEGKKAILNKLIESEGFEKFLDVKYTGTKRFGLDGGEALIPALEQIIKRGGQLGLKEIVFGMAHRGRLNVLSQVMGKPHRAIFHEFKGGSYAPDEVEGSGDVKYHLGASSDRTFDDNDVHLSLTANPSHLEIVNPVVLGKSRAKQDQLSAVDGHWVETTEVDRSKVLPLLLHGDAAFAGQGVVAECFGLSALRGHRTGGSIHVIINNQIGFTTNPRFSRSSPYPSDMAKVIEAPIFHVNGEDPEACVAVAQLAVEFRQKFRRDVFIDLQCYRRYGHNEQDEVSFTQPKMVKMIKAKPSVLRTYADKLLGEGVIQEADVQAIRHRIDEALEQAQAAARKAPNDPTIDPGSARWDGLRHEYSHEPVDTAVSMDMLREVCAALGRVPDGFNLNPKLRSLLKGRASLPETGRISYADAESLAYGTLLLEGVALRLSGQDCRRGTFSHRHAVLRDTETAEPYIPLNHIRELGVLGTDTPPGSPGSDGKPRQAKFCVYDSPLSEAGVLAFDYGYSLSDPNMLVLWEAQFGDFVNGAQVIIDQFIASAEAKWERWSGLTMLLPHGYEGAGPEHSSCRYERFLQLCGQDNIQVVYPTDAAQAFHLFRRQVKRSFRKPLIVMTPKSLLRVETSDISELVEGRFREMLDDPMFEREGADRSKVSKVVLVCGKFYYELDKRRRELGLDNVALVRIEQLYPFHHEMLAGILRGYPVGAELVYAQEEPRNTAGYQFVSDRIMSDLGRDRPRYIGRPAAASPATGSKKQHKREQEQLITDVIGPKPNAGADATKITPASAHA